MLTDVIHTVPVYFVSPVSVSVVPNVIVKDVDYKDGNHPEMFGLWQDPDEQLIEHYGLDWDQVNCIEAI